LFDAGISPELDLLDAGLAYGIIVQAGAWFSINGTKIAQGREQVIEYLKANPDTMKQVRQTVLDAMNLHGSKVLVMASEEDDEQGMTSGE
jgi:recombination protein RecA